MREHSALFAAILAVVALVSGLTVGVIGLVGQSAIDGAATPERRSLVTSIADLRERARIVYVEWPSGPNQVSVQFFAAERLQLQPGDTVRIEDSEFTVG